MMYCNFGHIEEWRSVPEYGGWYEVSNFGRLRSYHCFGHKRREQPKLMKPSKTWDGYLYVTLCKDAIRKQVKVHHIVAMAFLPARKEGLQIDHINGIKTDNRVENLEWVTPKENTQRSVKLGLKPHGENHWNHKLTCDEASEIRRLYSTGQFTHRELGKKFGVSHSVVGKIIRNQMWKNCHIKRYREVAND